MRTSTTFSPSARFSTLRVFGVEHDRGPTAAPGEAAFRPRVDQPALRAR